MLITTLGVIHLYYTFFTNAFSSTNERMIEEMKVSSPVLTQKITMWNSWVGFNGSHSSGVIFIGLINAYFAFRYFNVLRADHLFFIFTILMISFYVWLAGKYWFNVPFIGLSIALACFLASYSLVLTNK